MPVFSQTAFVVCVALCYMLMQLRLPLARSTWFGLLNAVAVALLFGILPLLLLLVVSLAAWTGLRFALAVRSKRPNSAPARLAGPVLYLGIGLLFVMHKSLIEPANDFAGLFPVAGLAKVANWPGIHGAIQVLQLVALSYVVLRLVDLVRSVLDGTRLANPLTISGYLVPFFMTPAGPINIYSDHVEMDRAPARRPGLAPFIDAVFLVAAGYFLKFVIAQTFSLFVNGVDGTWPTGTVGGTAIFLIYVLVEFSGYSLIALGVGTLLGIPTPVNFHHPYLATTVGEFWTRWHMSLGAFVRRNLYTPAQVALLRRFGVKNRSVSYATNLVALWLPFAFVGIWHRFTWSFFLWGLSLGAIVALEKLVRDRLLGAHKARLKRLQWFLAPLGVLYTLVVVVVTLHIASGDFQK